MQALRNFWHNSWTKTWAGIQYFTGCLLLASGPINEFIVNPEIKAQIALLNPPPHVAALIVALGVITFIASEHKPNEKTLDQRASGLS